MGIESGPSCNMNVNGYYQYNGNAFDPKAISRNYSIRPFRLRTAVIAYNLLHFDSRTNQCVEVEIASEKKEKLLFQNILDYNLAYLICIVVYNIKNIRP